MRILFVCCLHVALVMFAALSPAQATEDQPLSGLSRFFQQFGHDLRKGAQALGDDVDQIITGSTTRTVTVPGDYKPGSIIIRTSERKLYFVETEGRAVRYGIGVGREGFQWGGVSYVSRKKEWPDWRPPAEMIKREKEQNGRDIPAFMPGGPDNPLGARALYLGSTLYRIHGTNESYTIGGAVSSGCIRMRNSDVIDLYKRVAVGAKVYVYH